MPIINEEGKVIQHYGVKGMKWGVRKERIKSAIRREIVGKEETSLFTKTGRQSWKKDPVGVAAYNLKENFKRGLTLGLWKESEYLNKEQRAALKKKKWEDFDKEAQEEMASLMAEEAAKKAQKAAKQAAIDLDHSIDQKFADSVADTYNKPKNETPGEKAVRELARDINNRAADTWKPGMTVRDTLNTILSENKRMAEKSGFAYDEASDKKFWTEVFEANFGLEDE